MALVAEQLAAAITHELPPELRQAAPALADLLARLSTGAAVTPDDVSPDIAAVLRSLAGRQVPVGAKVLDFSGAQTGDVRVGDVAGGNVTKLTIPITRSTTQTISAGEGSTISQVIQLTVEGAGHTIMLGAGNANAAATEPPRTAPSLTDGASIFLADGGTGSPALTELATLLRLRGLRVWREPELGDLTRRTYDERLSASDAAVIALTADSCEADRLLRVELPAIWARFAQQAPFWVVPVIAGVGDRAADRTISAGGLRLADLRAFALAGDTHERDAQLADLARLVLQNVALPHLRASVSRDDAVELRLFSHPAAGATGRADLVLDWVERFGTRQAPLWPQPDDWARALIPALAEVRRVIGDSSTPKLRIDGRFHLSAAYALGHQFATTAGIKVDVKSTTSDEWWGGDRSGPAGEALVLEEVQTGAPGREVAIEISLAQDARGDVTEFLKEQELPIGRRVQLTSPPVLTGNVQEARAFVRSPAHAFALADQIADAILRSKRAPRIHLFGPLPQALAVLVGLRLNTARLLQCYEYVRDSATYVPACELR